MSEAIYFPEKLASHFLFFDLFKRFHIAVTQKWNQYLLPRIALLNACFIALSGGKCWEGIVRQQLVKNYKKEILGIDSEKIYNNKNKLIN